jgi:ABC-type sulfate/molybdate transport systems ATPase subunit
MTLEVEISQQLPDFTLSVQFSADEQTVGILGPSGAGKTMLLHCIAGLVRPDRGRIVLDGEVLLDTDRHIRVPARNRRIGLLFQHYALFPHRTVAENVAFGLPSSSADERLNRVRALLERTHAAELQERYPRQLSGGEQQRVALARALAIEPRALLLDEPLSALDTHLRSQIETQLQETFASFRRPALLVTHNVEEAYSLGERLMVLSRGQIAAFGPKEAVFRHPPNLEVARLSGCKNFSRMKAVDAKFIEAIDWNCRLQIESGTSITSGHVGIRAHHIDFLESHDAVNSQNNVFPCWLVRSSETPFRITLFLRLHRPPEGSGAHDLQAEVFKEKWERFRHRPLPWHVRLAPDSLFVVAD